MSKVIQISESALRRVIREEVAKATEPKESAEWISIAEFRKRTGLSYGKVRTLYTSTRPYIFTVIEKGKYRRVNYTAYKQTA